MGWVTRQLDVTRNKLFILSLTAMGKRGHVLAQYLGDVEAERFIALIQREPFDYTQWRKGIDEELSIRVVAQ